MRPETAIIEIHGQYRIHTEFYGNPSAQQTIILVNGSLSTTASFAQTVKYLQPHCNVVLYDQPYAGQSKPHNENRTPISKECEARILLELIERFRADVVMSFSWGGVATLLALAQRPGRIRRAVVNSFSPQLNPAMLDYLHRGLDYLAACDRTQVGNLVNENHRPLPAAAVQALQLPPRQQPGRARIPPDALPYPRSAAPERR